MEINKAETLVIGGLFAGAFGLCLTASSPWHWIGGFGMWGTGEVLRSRRKLEYVDVFKGSVSYLQDAIGEVNESALPITQTIDQKRQQLAVAALKQLPMGDRLADQFIAKQGLTTDWFNGFEKRSAVVCGESKDGKSHLLLWRVQRFLQQHPDGEIYICDPDYGSSHEGSKPNDWFGLPLGKAVFIEMCDIEQVIHLVATEVANRAAKTADAIRQGKAKPQFKPILLIVDEWISFKDALNDNQLEEVIKSLRNITNRGIKQGGVTFLLGLHDLSVGSSGLPRALLKLLECILLYRASQSKRNYDNLDTSDRQVEDILKQMTAVPRVVKDLRPCVVFTDKSLAVKALPPLELEQFELLDPDAVQTEAIDPDQEWLSQVWTAELEAKLLKRMVERQQQGKQAIALTEFWVSMAGQQQKDQRNTNPRYVLFKSKIETLASGFQVAQKPEEIESGKSPAISESLAVPTEQEFQDSFENPFTFPEGC